MKRAFFGFTVAIGLALTSCGGNSSGNAGNTQIADTMAVAPKTAPNDVLDSTSKQVGDTVTIADIKKN